VTVNHGQGYDKFAIFDLYNSLCVRLVQDELGFSAKPYEIVYGSSNNANNQ